MKIIFTLLVILSFLGCNSSSDNTSTPGSGSSSTQPGGSTPNTPGTNPANSIKRDAAFQPFSINSPWNIPLANSAIYSDDNDPCTKDLTQLPPTVNSENWSHPVYIASDILPNADPLTAIFLDAGNNIVFKIQSRIPISAVPALPIFHGDCQTNLDTEGDAHLHVIDPTHHFADEMFRAFKRADGSWKTCGYTRTDLYSSGVGLGGERAYGGSALGGLIRKDELTNGIFHALAFAIPRSKQKCCSPVWPATQIDDQAGAPYLGKNIPMGQLIALSPNLNLETLHLSPQALRIARALQNYGAYDVDSAGSNEIAFSIEVAASSKVEQNLEEELKKVIPFLRCVTNNGEDNIGGGSLNPNTPRRAALAPALK